MEDLNNPLTEDQERREELVAYLDGELDPSESSRVEQLLADDAKYRHEMVRLEKVWGALDQIPRSTVDESFTKTTVEMVAVAVEKDVDHQRESAPLHSFARAAAILSIVVLTGAIGYLSAKLIWPDPNLQLEQNLAVIENVDPYLVHGGVSPSIELDATEDQREQAIQTGADELMEFLKELNGTNLFSAEEEPNNAT